ncbi:MAG: Zn-dependent alcohol dehydrogenase [Deltaproteobacteria bacterium]|nr:Zn-dependent alcohol dehydrogenase [Deltaproteobacteria bacterium]MBW2678136.1 Zn-dependent alcohol dehydrogenase [Deltaproteobacteria bacterium]
MKTKAAVSFETGKPMLVEELELDEPKTDDVLIKMSAVGLCHSDYHAQVGNRPVGMRPMVLGHEGAGVVVRVGDGVDNIFPGDHVVLMFLPSCGKCPWCLAGNTHACDLGPTIAKGPQPDGGYRMHTKNGLDVGQFCLLGAFSEYTVVHKQSVCVIDKDIPLEAACLVGCGVVGGFGAAVNRARIRPGSSVLIIGTGGIGTNIIQGAASVSATTIIAADRFDHKLEWSRSFGATHTINVDKENLVERVMEITDNRGVDYAFEAISRPETIAMAFDATAKLGKVVVVGLTPSTFDSLPISPLSLVLTQKTLMGSLYGTSNARIEIPKLLYMYKKGQIKLDELITNTYSLNEINQGYDDLMAGKNIRGIVKF